MQRIVISQGACLLGPWKVSSIHGKLAPELLSEWFLFHFAFLRLLYFHFSWFMDVSSMPGLYLVSESLTRLEDSTSILWRHPTWGQCPKQASGASQPQSASGRTPTSDNQEHGATGRRKMEVKKCPSARLEQWCQPGSPGKQNPAGSCSRLLLVG